MEALEARGAGTDRTGARRDGRYLAVGTHAVDYDSLPDSAPRILWTMGTARRWDPSTCYRMGQYPAPNPLASSADFERFTMDDLRRMGRGRLIRERSDLMDAMRYARRADVPAYTIPYPADGRGCGWCPFGAWVRERLRIIGGLLDGRAAA